MYLSYFNPIGLRNKTCTVVLPPDSCHFLYPNMLDIQVRTNLELHLTVRRECEKYIVQNKNKIRAGGILV